MLRLTHNRAPSGRLDHDSADTPIHDMRIHDPSKDPHDSCSRAAHESSPSCRTHNAISFERNQCYREISDASSTSEATRQHPVWLTEMLLSSGRENSTTVAVPRWPLLQQPVRPPNSYLTYLTTTLACAHVEPSRCPRIPPRTTYPPGGSGTGR